MAFQIPFTRGSLEKVKRRSAFFKKFVRYKRNAALRTHLENAGVDITREEYVAIAMRSALITLVVMFIVASTVLTLFHADAAVIIALLIAAACAGFVYNTQLAFPKVYSNRREKEIERNLIPALQDMLVQLNAGVPLYSILINISAENYGPLSEEFKKAVKKMSAGYPQIEVLEELGERNSSLFFRRTLWQISNGMRAGSDLAIVIKDSIKSLNEEQLIQIQNYGNKLNPLIMFYMLISVILPALAITFLTVISSLVSLPSSLTTLLFFGLFGGVVFIQVIFIGIIRSIRPSLL